MILNQGTEEWHKWRNAGIGSSDAPIIMGVSPYSTPYKLWAQKLGLEKSNSENFVTELGHRFEDPARAQFALETGIEVEPDCVEHKEMPQFRASLDGLNVDQKIFVEIKYMGEKNLELVQSTQQVLEHHYDQIQHQFLVTGFTKSYYVAYGLNQAKSDIAKLVTIEIFPNLDYIQNKLIPKEIDFLKLLKDQTPPPLMTKDCLAESNAMNIALARRWQSLKGKSAEIQKEMDAVEAQLKKLTNTHPRVSCGEVLIQKTVRKGNINYLSVPELEKVDLEQYRKNPITVISIRESKGDKNESADET